VRELLSEAMLRRYGLVDPTAALALASKAHRQDGRMAGEREEMALVGALTLQLLAHAYQDDFAARAAARLRRLDGTPAHVHEDRLAHAG